MSQAAAGVFAISIDLELAWGERHRPLQLETREAILCERNAIDRLLSLFETHDVRATWAIVGRLLAPNAETRKSDAEQLLWEGEDIVDRIRTAVPEQEVASHSFAHIPYGEARTDSRVVLQDIEAARQTHRAYMLPFETFVFPWNQIGHTGLLFRAGIHTYRGTQHRWYDRVPFPVVRRLLHFGSYLLATPPPTHRPTINSDGMVNIPESLLFLSRMGIRRIVPPEHLLRMAKAGLNRAADRAEVFHLWFHPVDFVHEVGTQCATMAAILRHADTLRKQDRLRILPLCEIGRLAGAPDNIHSGASRSPQVLIEGGAQR